MSPWTIGTLGFVGLGVMGEAMCRNLVRAHRFDVRVHDIAPEPVRRLVEQGARPASSVDALIDQTDLVITCLPGGEEVRSLLFGPNRPIDRLRPGRS